MDFKDVFGAEDLSRYKNASILFEDGSCIELDKPELIAELNDFLYLKDINQYTCIKLQNIYRITLSHE